MIQEVSQSDVKEFVKRLIPVPDSLSKDIEKACRGVYPLHDVQIRKVVTLITEIKLGMRRGCIVCGTEHNFGLWIIK